MPVHPIDRHIFGLCWKGQAYVDQAYIPFGLRSAPNLFTKVADAATWALMQAGITFVMYYLDDHLFFLPPLISVKHFTAVTSTGYFRFPGSASGRRQGRSGPCILTPPV